MSLAGIPVSADLVADLVTMLRAEYYFKAADTLDHRLRTASHVGLTIRERTAVDPSLASPVHVVKTINL